MNTNSNVYTIIYTTLVCVLVAAILAFASQKLAPKQQENEKAENISQILTAGKFGTKEEWQAAGNAAIVQYYKDNAAVAFTVNAEGQKVRDLDIASAEVYGVPGLKAQNYNIKGEKPYEIPVYQFKNGITVVAIYGAGLWGPVWGYISLCNDLQTICGAYFDHESETPGLGGKIKDDPSFRAAFAGEKITLGENPFDIVKGGAPGGVLDDSKVDAITGATMTSKGLDAAIDNWISSYVPYINAVLASKAAETENAEEE